MRTWDGLPVSSDKPYGASVIVWRRGETGPEFLVLHRPAAGGVDFEGDWAWTPPSGARLPGEAVVESARRELLEETGLDLDFEATDAGTEEWAVFVAEAPAEATVALDDEHDRFAWLLADDAIVRCLPSDVGEQLRAVAARLEQEPG